MKRISTLFAAALGVGLVGASATAFAHGGKTHQLEVIAEPAHAKLERGMKLLTTGLGVKCSTCHVKDDYASDAKPAKLAARDFLAETLGQKKKSVRAKALSELLVVLEKDRAKDETKVWQAVKLWKKRPQPKKVAPRQTDPHAGHTHSTSDATPDVRSKG